jgi:hypothetical protein
VKPWPWAPSLRREFERWGLPWEVVEEEPSEGDLRGSPGNAFYDGSKVVVARATWQPWVAHELAHFIVCRSDTPSLLRRWNYGMDVEDGMSDKQMDAALAVAQEAESDASTVTCALLIRLRLPWRKAADELNEQSAHDLPFPLGGARYWRALRESILHKASPYMD